MKNNLLDYNFPEDLKNMTPSELDTLAVQIRDFLINSVSETGGHLASNLGVVELTLALHKMFDFEKDKVIWDVGHQSYVHKILTGRAKDFGTLRKYKGLAGFPKAKESTTDAFDTGHSSVSISAAAGYAMSRDIKGEKNEVIAVIGDGSLTGGEAYEGLNNIGDKKSKVIVILNDNGISISKNVGGMTKHLGSLRTFNGYIKAKNFVKKKVAPSSKFGESVSIGLAAAKNHLKYSIMEPGGVIFEELGFTYLGPVDGHNIEDLLDVMEKAKSLNEPVLIHVMTKKGKGYYNAEKNPGKFHGIGPFDKTTGELKSKPKDPSYSSLIGEFILDLGKKDDKVVAITAAMGEATGLGEFSRTFPDRFFDVGIAEQHAVTFACGLAKGGLRPVVCIYSSFLQRAYDQIIHDCAMQKLPIIFCIDRAGVVGADGETHHGNFDLTYLRSVPGMTVLTPSNGVELKAALEYAHTLDTPVAIRYPRGNSTYDKEIMSTYNINDISLNKRVLPATDVDIWACGKMFDTAEKVVDALKDRGIKAGLVKVTQVKPLETNSLNDLVYSKKLKHIFTIEDNTVMGGFGEGLNSTVLSSGIKAPVTNFGWPDMFIPHGSFDELAEEFGLSANKITERIIDILERKA